MIILNKNGLNATVWQGKAGTPNAGKTYVSMTGTQPGTDFLNDVDLTVSGAAWVQLPTGQRLN